MAFKVTINKTDLMRELTVNNNRAMTMAIRNHIEPSIREAQKEMVKDFDSHPVTREVQGGAGASNTSGTLGGYGNLFAFLGFPDGDYPVKPIRDMLAEKMTFAVRRTNDQGRYKITLNAPSKDELFAASPLPWAAGKSWAEGIEKGISNLGFFLFKDGGDLSGSRSGAGIQSQNMVRSVSFKTTPYLSKILDDLRKNVLKA